MITIVDLGVSNIGSVIRALEFLKISYKTTDSPSEVVRAEKILLPGVGSFKSGIQAIQKKNLKDILIEKAINRKTPFFGVCLGMQLMFSKGLEGGEFDGLGLIEGRVCPLNVDRHKYPVPHMGWNDVKSSGLAMFSGIPDKSHFYFVHSYSAEAVDPTAQFSLTQYGDIDIVAAVQKNNIWGAQFHPERSQKMGLLILKNFQEFSCCAPE